jgi:hypothetical protein
MKTHHALNIGRFYLVSEAAAERFVEGASAR